MALSAQEAKDLFGFGSQENTEENTTELHRIETMHGDQKITEGQLRSGNPELDGARCCAQCGGDPHGCGTNYEAGMVQCSECYAAWNA